MANTSQESEIHALFIHVIRGGTLLARQHGTSPAAIWKIMQMALYSFLASGSDNRSNHEMREDKQGPKHSGAQHEAQIVLYTEAQNILKKGFRWETSELYVLPLMCVWGILNLTGNNKRGWKMSSFVR